jgi:hypothetical protein
MEEIISKDDEQNTHFDVENREEFSSSSSRRCYTNGNFLNKRAEKMIHIILLLAPWWEKLKMMYVMEKIL